MTELSVADVLEAYLASRAAGQAPPEEELLAAHPRIADRLRDCLKSLRFLRQVTGDEDDAAPIVPGTRIGDFRIRREIGRGGMGVVFEAEQISLQRRVALKMLPFAAVLHPTQLQRFKNEAQAAAHLHHTHIVPVYSVGCEHGVHYYAMQFIDGSTVADIVSELRAHAGRGRRPPCHHASVSVVLDTITKDRTTSNPAYYRAVARLGSQAAEALAHAHDQGVIHRDIKPGNLLVDAHGHLWITDFGLASSRSGPGLTVTGDLVGTFRYMSPEQALADRGPVDHRTDIYSLGATLYEFSTLAPAVGGHDPQQILQEIARREPKPARSLDRAVPAELETILVKAMARIPDERYATAQELADDLGRFLESKPIRARRPTLWKRITKWSRRHTAVVVSVVALLIISVVGLAASLAVIRTAYRRESEAHREAAAMFAKAREAVDRMLTEVAERDLSHVPHIELIRRRLLEQALAMYQGLLHDHDDAALRFEMVRAHRRIGDLQHMLGELQEAEEAYTRARVLLEDLGASVDAPGRIHECARLQSGLGKVFLEANRWTEAEAAYREALRLSECLAGVADATPGHRRELAAARHHLSMVLWRRDRFAEAEEQCRSAVAGLEGLAAEYPDDPVYACDAAKVYGQLANILRFRNRHAAAEKALLRALNLNLELVASHGDVPSYRFGLAATHNNLGIVLWRWIRHRNEDRSEEAAGHVGRARDVFARLMEDFPHVARYRSAFTGASSMLARILAERGNLAKALAVHRLWVQRLPDHPQGLHELACFLADCEDPTLRDPATAVALARRSVELAPEDWTMWSGLGASLYRAGDYRAAVDALEKAVRLRSQPRPMERGGVRSGKNGYVWLLAAMARWRLGEHDAARDLYDKAVAWIDEHKHHSELLERRRVEAQELLRVRETPGRD